MRRSPLLFLLAIPLCLACGRTDAPPASPDAARSGALPASGATSASVTSAVAGPAPVEPGARAEIGKPAPEFTLADLDGAPVTLSTFKGKTVVLEWFNPGCPFVRSSHTKGSLKDAAKRHVKAGVVWLAINSGAPGKQGHGAAASREGAKTFSMEHPVLLDETGAVGKAYGATNTPHVFVIDPKGVLAYRGAADNSPDGEGESPTDGKLVSYVDTTLEALAAGKTPSPAETRAYGCGVKYAK